MFKKRCLRDVDYKNKKVLVRADLNVPLNDKGAVKDALRIKKVAPTLQALIKEGCEVKVVTHFKRSETDEIEERRLSVVAEALSDELKTQVIYFADCLDTKAVEASKDLKGKGIVLVDNELYYEKDKKNDAEYVKKLADGFDLFVNDAFACSHRKHGSVVGVTKHLDSCVGMALEKELEALRPFVDEATEKPVVLVLGGTRLDTKIGILEFFMERVDKVLVGGALANTLLMAQGFDVGSSIDEEEHFDLAQDLMLKAESSGGELLVPVDVKVADRLESGVTALSVPVEDVIGSMKIGDIGPHTISKYKAILAHAKTILWYGPMGKHEIVDFSRGSKEIANAIADSKAYSVVAGGKTLDVLSTYDISQDRFSHVSTGGTALVEFLSGKKLPGIAALPSDD